jgi:hypothetical protein
VCSSDLTEAFLGYLLYLFWSAWLGRRGHWPAGMHYGPIVVGIGLLGAQALATRAIMLRSGDDWDVSAIETARWSSVALVLAGLALDVVFTVRHLRSGPPAPTPPPA